MLASLYFLVYSEILITDHYVHQIQIILCLAY